MSSGISPTGSIGYVGNIMVERNKKMAGLLGVDNYDHKSFLVTSGVDEKATLQIYEDAIEGNEFWGGDGTKGNMLSWGSYYNNHESEDYNDYIFQGQAKPYIGTYTEIDFNTGQYKQYDEEVLFEHFFTKGEGSEKPYDFVNLGQGTINFFEFSMTNGTGTDLNPIIVNSTGSANKRPGANYVFQNVNLESGESASIMRGLLANATQWLSDEEMETLEKYLDKGDQDGFLALYKEYMITHFDPSYNPEKS